MGSSLSGFQVFLSCKSSAIHRAVGQRFPGSLIPEEVEGCTCAITGAPHVITVNAVHVHEALI